LPAQKLPPACPSQGGAGSMPARFKIDHTVLAASW
jgi:hypothetical protein